MTTLQMYKRCYPAGYVRKYIGHLFYVHTNLTLAVFCLFGAAIEIACGIGLGDEFMQVWVTQPAAAFLSIAALFIVWGVVRFEVQS